mgnify:CR=1 FL=1
MKFISPKVQIQKDKALQVHKLILTNPDMTQAEACAQVGVDPKTYRKWIALADESLEVFEQSRIENDRLDYANYLVKKSEISDQFIQDAMKPGVSITERIKALQYIDNRIDELGSRYHTVDVEAEQDLLSGPKQEMGISSSSNNRKHL